ncbi:MAG: DUF3817 domain-containing protein [Actinomycetota bacterium]|nr:DUF3817 domain-containing protein [Actinomycetota bacterium]
MTAGPDRTRWVRTAFRVTAFAEAVSWGGLLAAMAFKYVISDNPNGVHVMGPIHGAAFLAYVGVTLVAARTFRWRAPATLVGLAASIPPFGSAVFEVWADRRGHLAAPGLGRDGHSVVAGAGRP